MRARQALLKRSNQHAQGGGRQGESVPCTQKVKCANKRVTFATKTHPPGRQKEKSRLAELWISGDVWNIFKQKITRAEPLKNHSQHTTGQITMRGSVPRLHSSERMSEPTNGPLEAGLSKSGDVVIFLGLNGGGVGITCSGLDRERKPNSTQPTTNHPRSLN